jgi:hypothetical protein
MDPGPPSADTSVPALSSLTDPSAIVLSSPQPGQTLDKSERARDLNLQYLQERIEDARSLLQSSSTTPHMKALMLRLARLDDGDGKITNEEYAKIMDEISSVVSSLHEYWTLLGVVAALILSMALGPCLNKVERSDLGDNDLDDPTSDLSEAAADALILIHTLLMFSCCMLQGLAIFLCCHFYNHTTLVAVDPLDKLAFIMSRGNNPAVPQAMCVLGVFLMILGTVAGMALYISVLSSILAACPLTEIWRSNFGEVCFTGGISRP